MGEYEVIIVGARAAGATAAIALARAGARVALVDRDTFPSDTLSSHVFFPNTTARFERLGVLDHLRKTHTLHAGARVIFQAWDSEVVGNYPTVDGTDESYTIRRIVLDTGLVEVARAAGAEVILGDAVVELLGAGTDEDPVRGVVLQSGEQLRARWTIGADGRNSTVAKRLGLEKQHEKRGSCSFFLAYFRGLPVELPWCVHLRDDLGIVYGKCEDDVGAIMLMGWPDLVAGTAEERERRWEDGIRSFPTVFEPAVIDAAERFTEVRVASETMLRGFYRAPTGPGWALIGDANHFKHPATAQGISDAVEQALHIADALGGSDPELKGFEAWRDERADGHYDLSFLFGQMPTPDGGRRFFAGLAEPGVGDDMAATLARQLHPSRFTSPERMARWFAEP